MARIVGLTGGIGCGKSAVAELLAELGAHVIDADELARQAVARGSKPLAAIQARFGDGVIGQDGALNRAALAKIVFTDPHARSALEAIVHPEVMRLAKQRMDELEREGVEVIIYDVPLLYESGLDRILPEVIVVSAPEHVQRARIASRDGLDVERIDARIRAQLPLSEKMARATWVIDNGGSFDETKDQVEALWRTWRGK